MLINDIFILIAAGILVGLIGSFFGIGGGVLIIPILNFLFPELPQQSIIACSLSIIAINSVIHTINYSKHYQYKYKIILSIALFSIISSVLVSLWVQHINSTLLRWIFAIFLLGISAYMVIRSDQVSENRSENSFLSSILIGISTGLISGFTGVGGGVANIPLLIRFTKIDIQQIAAYSNAIMIFTTLSAVSTFAFAGQQSLQFYSIGYLLPELILYMAIGGLIGSKAGIRINLRTEPKNYKKSLTLLFVVLSITMIIKLIIA
ncbi:MAG: sulfite exporter TauE/SafE family protein [Calditrichaeota bacterium]|nr:sulfite exporter TauE/SafE family protein [Calditrichota bacterium]